MAKIERIYISHTTGCCGWDLDALFEKTLWAKACRTSRWPRNSESNIKMLDWCFRKPNWERHLEIAMSYPLEVAMAPDYFADSDIDVLLGRIEELKKYVPLVYIPIHAWHEALTGYDIALPCAPSFAKQYQGLFFEIAPFVKHLLGGSPSRQWELGFYFPNLRSIDGNSLFQSAIRHGAYWEGGVWHCSTNDAPRLSNVEYFMRSVQAMNQLWS